MAPLLSEREATSERKSTDWCQQETFWNEYSKYNIRQSMIKLPTYNRSDSLYVHQIVELCTDKMVYIKDPAFPSLKCVEYDFSTGVREVYMSKHFKMVE